MKIKKLQQDCHTNRHTIEDLEKLSCELKFKYANALVDLDEYEEAKLEKSNDAAEQQLPRRKSFFARARSMSFNLGKKPGIG